MKKNLNIENKKYILYMGLGLSSGLEFIFQSVWYYYLLLLPWKEVKGKERKGLDCITCKGVYQFVNCLFFICKSIL